MSTVVFGGRLFLRQPDGSLVPVDADPTRADEWICRRVVDFPGQRLPATAAVSLCGRCLQPIAFNPDRATRVPPLTPKVCMQCAGIEPLPIEEGH